MKKVRLGIFISGQGSNARAIISHFKNHTFVKVVSVYSNNATSPLLADLSHFGVVGRCFSKLQLRNGELLQILEEDSIDFIALAGFLLKIPLSIIERYPDRVVNMHPALLPKFGGKGMYGIYVHRAVVQQGEKQSGITIHYINQHYDQGDIIFQKSIPLAFNETPESLSKKIRQLEHKYFPEVLERICSEAG